MRLYHLNLMAAWRHLGKIFQSGELREPTLEAWVNAHLFIQSNAAAVPMSTEFMIINAFHVLN